MESDCKEVSDDRDALSKRRVDLLQDERYPYPYLRCPDHESEQSLYVHSEKHMIYADGWYGNIIPSAAAATVTDDEQRSNCMFVPLPGIAPLCGIIATKYISKGEKITQQPHEPGSDSSKDKTQLYKLTNSIAKEYANEIGELIPYLQMACNSHIDTSTQRLQTHTYHAINENYHNLQKIHSNPDIYTIKDFLSKDECERIVRKAQLNIQPCLVKNEDTGAVEIDPSRTSTNANIPRCEVPTLTNKILELVSSGNNYVDEEQLEIFQVLNYKKGQEFKRHTDGFDRPTTACGFHDSGRIATIFCYLNDIQKSAGGTTLFTQLDLHIQPQAGMAVIHFPMSLDLVEDKMTEHQGSIVKGDHEKWILTTWIWKHFKADYRYSEDNLGRLSDDII